MELPINTAKPLVMHIDLNSCFATIEQQANPFLRGKPIAVAAYDTPNGCILAPSIEAKRYGVKTGMRVKDARVLIPGLIVKMADPAKYRDVHARFKKIFESYSPNVYPKSIDEAVIDFKNVQNLNPDLLFVAREIKRRMKEEIGEWIVCSIGISTNKSLAKLAAGLKKPDGLTVIDHTNLLEVYKKIKLTDFCGINTRYQIRLNIGGIITATEFFRATCQTLQKQVFRSVVGRYWYERLRGWEVDGEVVSVKTIGHQYALKRPTGDKRELARILMKLCEKTGRRLRRQGFSARGVHIACNYKGGGYWHKGRCFTSKLVTTGEIYQAAFSILTSQPGNKIVSKLSITCYNLGKSKVDQMSLWNDKLKERAISKTIDTLNDRYGEFTVIPALMMDTENIAKDAIAFGNLRG